MTEKQMFDFLVAGGLSEHGAAVLLGHFQDESGLNSRNLQNSFQKRLGHTDDSYTEAVDNGTYGNFDRDGAGYGLAQWTYWSRKANLRNFAEQAGIAYRTMQGYIGGEREPNAEGMSGIAKAGVNLNWLVSGEGEMFLSDVKINLTTKEEILIKYYRKMDENTREAFYISFNEIVKKKNEKG